MRGFDATKLYCLQSCVTFLALFRPAVSMIIVNTNKDYRYMDSLSGPFAPVLVCLHAHDRERGGGERGGAEGSLKEPLQLTADIAPPGM